MSLSPPPEERDGDAAGPLALVACFVLAVLIALHCDRVDRCESTPCDFGTPTLIDGECTCTAPAQ